MVYGILWHCLTYITAIYRNGQGADLRSAVTRLEARMHALEAPENGLKGERQYDA